MKCHFLLISALFAVIVFGPAACTKVSESGVKAELPAGYRLSNPSATQKTKAVYRFLCENFGKKIISGQQESTWMGSPDYEMDLIRRETGKTPAMRGLDYMNSDFDGVTKRAKDWWDRGGLVTICWHTGIYGGAFRESQNDVPDFRRLLNEETEEHRRMIANWDQAARSLAELQDAGVVVLVGQGHAGRFHPPVAHDVQTVHG